MESSKTTIIAAVKAHSEGGWPVSAVGELVLWERAGLRTEWTSRDLDGHSLRVYRERFVNGADVYSLEKDYVWRDSGLLASLSPTDGTRHFHLDHLGTPRLVTNLLGTRTAFHAYYPYGEEATAFNQDTEPMKFTGHERDLASAAGAADDLDYMHARFYSPLLGRFFSVDSAGANLFQPSTWNRYSYVGDAPLKYVDPDGRVLKAYYLVTGVSSDPTRHSAVYFKDDDPASLVDLVFSH